MIMRPIKKSVEDNIPVSRFRAYSNHPRKKPSGDEFDAFCADIKERGILVPIKARFTLGEKNDSGEELYEIISGHCRWEAAKAVGLETIPALVETVQDNDADKQVVSFNFGVKNMTPSEIGKFCKLWVDAHNKQGQRPSIAGEASSREQVAAQFGVSSSKAYRYMRLAELIPEFQNAADDKKITQTVAEHVSFLKDAEQRILHKVVFKKGEYELSRPQSTKLKTESKKAEQAGGSLNKTKIIEILDSVNDKDNLSNTKKPTSIKVSYESIEKYITEHFENQEITEDGVQEIIMKALEAYSNKV